MNRGMVAAVLLFGFVLAGPVFAQAPQPSQSSKAAFEDELAKAGVKKFTGTVLSHDAVCHCVVVKTPEGELTLQDDYAKFMQKYDRAKGLLVGSKVKGSYKTVNYIHYLVEISYVQAATTAFVPKVRQEASDDRFPRGTRTIVTSHRTGYGEQVYRRRLTCPAAPGGNGRAGFRAPEAYHAAHVWCIVEHAWKPW